MESKDTLVLTNVSKGFIIKVARLRLNWRQVDLASKANVSVEIIVYLEKDRNVLPSYRNRVFDALHIKKDNIIGFPNLFRMEEKE